MERGQFIPGRGGLGVVGIVIAKIQYEPVHTLVTPGQDRAKRMSLFPGEVAFVLRNWAAKKVGVIGVVVF